MMKLNLGCSDDLKPGWLNVDRAYPDLKPGALDSKLPEGSERIFVNRDGVPCAFDLVDLNRPWPWPDSSIETVYAHDVFEHVLDCQHLRGWNCEVCMPPATTAENTETIVVDGRRSFYGKVHAMNEAHRVLVPGGILDLAVPSVHMMDGKVCLGAFTDPTHKQFWTVDDQYYFMADWNNPDGERGRLGPAYGVTALFKKQVWRLLEYGNPRRAKVIGLLEAVK